MALEMVHLIIVKVPSTPLTRQWMVGWYGSMQLGTRQSLAGMVPIWTQIQMDI